MQAFSGVLGLLLVSTVVQVAAGAEENAFVLGWESHSTDDGDGYILPWRYPQVGGEIAGLRDFTCRGHGWGDEA